MERSPGARKTPFTFSASVHQQLSMYALAASAAGVGALALSSPAQGKIVYTPADVVLTNYHLDLNHDGTSDFWFVRLASSHGTTSRATATSVLWANYPAHQPRPNSVAGRNGPAPLWPGEEIGPKRVWRQSGEEVEEVKQFYNVHNRTDKTNFYGAWANGGKGFKAHYLGLKFLINGKVHFGWARLNTAGVRGGHLDVILTGYAYETIPGKAIIAGQTKGAADELREEDFGSGASLTNPIPATPQPASLGVLALGAQAVPPWRRKESALERN